MRRRWMGFMLWVTLLAITVAGQGVEISGTVGASADLLPAFGMDASFGVTCVGERWRLTSNTDIGLFPAFGGSERLTFSYDLDVLRFAASLSMDLVPFSLGRADISATIDAFDLAIGEQDPKGLISSDLTIGTTLNTTIDPYARLVTRFTYGDHWLSNTTTLSFVPFDVTSSLLGYVVFGDFDVADGDVMVTAYGYVAVSVIPFDFSYVQANAKVVVDGMTILNTVTYYGNTSLSVKSTVTLDLDPVTVKVWGSYSSAFGDPFGLGVSASLGWGPL